MSSRSTRRYLNDILKSCDRIREYLDGVTLEDYLSASMRQDAVERQLQILTEAAFRLGDEAARLCPTVDWRSIRGLGNFLRHEYDKITPEIIWGKLHNDLPVLEEAVKVALLANPDPDPAHMEPLP
ncbi:HepT-like ribonuclease domain-containing protein [Granulicella tundricola]|uniref:DUF86 domain-containing protein n=1 Tax=Granulicella tundricola (strain ATCC BAA-1859 / DSM 23138 / MP5ACTX9) TaxID=1198114 RepID=E8X4U1_GRATM|nr:HepT-like ribonuclease domain-containing protein [Granulicella tundricola]ADW70580.1 protein of unknown function DUF86 [Granulicella tundricola MP5ACTX9]